MKTIAITGGSGFIGRHLIAQALKNGDWRIRMLSRAPGSASLADLARKGVEIIEGNLHLPHSLQAFVDPGCTVVHLAYLRGADEQGNRVATANLLDACRRVGVARLIHTSTALVVGRATVDLVTEDTPCRPVTAYARTKLAIEDQVLEAARGGLEAVVVRPSAVFGAEGENLKKLARDLVAGPRWRNYLKSCLFGIRRMNLVHVSNVMASIRYLAEYPTSLRGEIFNVSDDDDKANNFADVERILMRHLGLPDYSLPRVPAPAGLLPFLLTMLGRDNSNPRLDYSPGKLLRLGFERPMTFEAGLADYAASYRENGGCK